MENDKYLTGFDLAFQTAMEHMPLLSEEPAPIMDAVGRIVSRDIFSTINAPSVNSSLKDGYAVLSEDIRDASEAHPISLELIGRIEAGSSHSYHVTSGKTVRILTGAAIPEGADAVLAEEFTRRDGNQVTAFADAGQFRNIMMAGTDVKKGDCLLAEGSEITPSGVSLLVAGGITTVAVRKRPRVGLLATGDEILLPGAEFQPGKLFASNLALQEAWLKSRGFETRFSLSGDTIQDLSRELEGLLGQSDVVITSGGAWEGDRDLIVKALDGLGWEKRFHHVRMGPGKAIGMGLIDGKPVFCLPGGPPSNEMAFLMIAYPAICKMAGYGAHPFTQLDGKLVSRVQGETTWTQFLHCTIEKKENQFFIQPIKLSSRLKSMANAKAILTIPEGVSVIEEGYNVTVCLLDHAIMKKLNHAPLVKGLHVKIPLMLNNKKIATPGLLVKKILGHYKTFLYAVITFMLLICIVFSGFIVFLTIKHHKIIIHMLKNGYTYQTSAEVMIKVDSPVKVNSPIKKVLQIPVIQTLHVTVPVKTEITLPLKQNFLVDLKHPVAIKIDHSFPINDIVTINFTAPVDTDIMASAFGVSKKVHIKGGIPIIFDIPISQEFRINDTFMLKINDPISIPIDRIFKIPVETEIEVNVPINLLLDVPLDTKIDTDIMIQGEVPVLVDFEIHFDLLEGITIKGIRMNPERM